MALTNKLGIVVDCRDRKGMPNYEGVREADRLLFEVIKEADIFPKQKGKLLDVGCGFEGSLFVNKYAELFPTTEVTYG